MRNVRGMTTPTTAAPTPSATLPAETSTAFTRRPGEVLDRVLAGHRTAIIRNDRRQIVLVDAPWYDRQPGASANMVSIKTTEGEPISRADYVKAVEERAETSKTSPIQLDAVEAELVAELLDELAAVYTQADPVGHLARKCASILYDRLGV